MWAINQQAVRSWLCLTAPVACHAIRIALAPPAQALESDVKSGMVQAAESDESTRLRLVQVVFRHGARTPLTRKYWDGATWEKGVDCGELRDLVKVSISNIDGGLQPENTHDAQQVNTVLPGGCSKGELTLPGQQQAIDLGAWLRQRYVQTLDFLPAKYQEGCVQGQTTNYQRTIATLRGVLSGLYPDASGIPVLTSHDVDEVLYGNTDSCERLRTITAAQAQALKDSIAADRGVKELEEKVRVALQLGSEERISMAEVHDAMTSLAFHGKPLPRGMTPQLLAGINKEATRRMGALIAPHVRGKHGEDILRLGMGQLFQKVVGNIDEAVSGADSTKPRIYLYSGHDTTIMPLLVTLGIKVEDWPDYNSNVVFELWEKKAQADGEPEHFIRVLYNKQEVVLDSSHKGSTVTSLAHFKDVTLKPYLMSRKDLENECRVGFSHDDSLPATAGSDVLQGL